LEKKISTFNRF